MNAKTLLGSLVSLLAVNWSSAQPQPGTVLWTYPIYVSATPAQATDGTVYVGSHDGLYAITNTSSAASSKWTFPCAEVKGVAVGFDGTLYVANASQNFYAVNPDGSQKWVYTSEYYGSSSPAIGRDNTIYVAVGDTLYALSETGEKKWDYRIFGKGIPAISRDGTIYVRNSQSPPTLYALSPTGALKWSAELSNGGAWDTDALAIGLDETIYVGSSGVHAFSPTGNQLWFNNSAFAGIVIGPDETIYANRGIDTSLVTLMPSGQERWQLYLPPRCQYIACWPPTTPAVDSSGTTYYTASNSILAVSSVGQVQWAVTLLNYGVINASSTTIGLNGVVYAGLSNSLFAVYGGSVGNSPWPMLQQNSRRTGKVERPALLNLQQRGDANFEFKLYSQIGQTNIVEISTNLISWTALMDVVVTNVPMDVIDLTASNSPTRFYRAVAP